MSDLRLDPAVERWLGCFLEPYRDVKFRRFAGWWRWLQVKEHFRGLSPGELVDFQRQALKGDNSFDLLDILQEYIRSKEGTHNSLLTEYTIIKSFFKHNRAPFPDDDFQINASRSGVRGRFTLEILKSLVDASDLDFKPFYLTLFMGLLDQERFIQFNMTCGEVLTDHLKTKGVEVPFRFEFSGRKRTRNKKQFHTYIGKDALAAWKEYFERIRGWPKNGESILVDQKGKPYTKSALRQRHLRLLEKLNYIKRGGGNEKRYGLNLHDLRDLAKTTLHLQGKKDNLDLDCVDFWMGHTVDPLEYDRFNMDEEYMLGQYRMAEKHLNITSGPSSVDLQKTQEKMKQYETLIQQMSGKFEEATRRVEEVERKLIIK